MASLHELTLLSRFTLPFFILYLINVESVPEPYCLKTFNFSNCGMPRTSVVHYYKPRSRCEVVHWYGCPTANMFANEYQCIQHCIARVFTQAPARHEEKKWDAELNEIKPNELDKEQMVNDTEDIGEWEIEPINAEEAATEAEQEQPAHESKGDPGEPANEEAGESSPANENAGETTTTANETGGESATTANGEATTPANGYTVVTDLPTTTP